MDLVYLTMVVTLAEVLLTSDWLPA